MDSNQGDAALFDRSGGPIYRDETDHGLPYRMM